MALSTTPEYKEFYLRNVAVNSGTKPDQESGYPTTYNARDAFGNSVVAYNRLLKNNIPSADVFSKLLFSIPFKKNSEDKATTGEQGLVKIAANASAKSGTNGTTFTEAIVASQLPTIEGINETDTTTNDFGSDFPLPNATANPYSTIAADSGTATRNKFQIKLSTNGFWTYFRLAMNYIRTYSSDGVGNRLVATTNTANPLILTIPLPAKLFKKVGDFIRIRCFIIQNSYNGQTCRLQIQNASSTYIDVRPTSLINAAGYSMYYELTLTRKDANTISCDQFSHPMVGIGSPATVFFPPSTNYDLFLIPADVTPLDFNAANNLKLTISSGTTSDTTVQLFEIVKTNIQ